MVYDGTHTQFFDRDSYREFTEAETEHEYDWEKCFEHMARTEHWGPWDETSGLLGGWGGDGPDPRPESSGVV